MSIQQYYSNKLKVKHSFEIFMVGKTKSKFFFATLLTDISCLYFVIG